VKEQGQDLWMNSSSEIPLTGGRSALPETNGGEALSPQKDLGLNLGFCLRMGFYFFW